MTDDTAAEAVRRGDAGLLARALQDSRADTLATFAATQAALPDLAVPLRPELNPPLWELGHVGWFQAWWLARFPAWAQGCEADPDLPRHPAARPDAEALYHSSQVPHDRRWSLPLPDADRTRDELAAQLAQTLAMLAALQRDGADQGPGADARLYFFRLALLHEDMHHEAALYMAQGLGVPIEDPRWQPPRLPPAPPSLALPAGTWRLGRAGQPGFAFDNELGALEVALPAVEIDAQVRCWGDLLPWIESGGYTQPRWWDADGQAWLARHRPTAPRVLRRQGTRWQQQVFGRWEPLDEQRPAVHLSAHEARAWCRWAGRRLPTEAEWERAAGSHPGWRWGDVWEWTATPLAPWPGFRPHPYRDYSAPWMDGRPVLRGGSWMTQPRLRHRQYRNFFPADRADVPAGLRSCAV